MGNQNQNLLEEIYQATKMGLDATRLVIPKVHDESLRNDMEQQAKNYKEMNSQAKAMLRKDGYLPEEKGAFKKAMLRGSIKMNTLVNSKPDHIAKMMINGTTMGIIDLTKKLNELDDSDAGAKKLAEDYLAGEQQNIEIMKKHL